MRSDHTKQRDGDIDRHLLSLIWACSRRTRKKAIDQTINHEILREIYNNQSGKCAISGVEMTAIHGQGTIPTNISLDRIDSSKGYTPCNVQLVCYIVNVMKNAFTTSELIWWCGRIVEHYLGRRLKGDKLD